MHMKKLQFNVSLEGVSESQIDEIFVIYVPKN